SGNKEIHTSQTNWSVRKEKNSEERRAFGDAETGNWTGSVTGGIRKDQEGGHPKPMHVIGSPSP
ncbi:MAG: hypothetical protein WA874_16120, partial [Chryseosolibacter sp.]